MDKEIVFELDGDQDILNLEVKETTKIAYVREKLKEKCANRLGQFDAVELKLSLTTDGNVVELNPTALHSVIPDGSTVVIHHPPYKKEVFVPSDAVLEMLHQLQVIDRKLVVRPSAPKFFLPLSRVFELTEIPSKCILDLLDMKSAAKLFTCSKSLKDKKALARVSPDWHLADVHVRNRQLDELQQMHTNHSVRATYRITATSKYRPSMKSELQRWCQKNTIQGYVRFSAVHEDGFPLVRHEIVLQGDQDMIALAPLSQIFGKNLIVEELQGQIPEFHSFKRSSTPAAVKEMLSNLNEYARSDDSDISDVAISNVNFPCAMPGIAEILESIHGSDTSSELERKRIAVLEQQAHIQTQLMTEMMKAILPVPASSTSSTAAAAATKPSSSITTNSNPEPLKFKNVLDFWEKKKKKV